MENKGKKIIFEPHEGLEFSYLQTKNFMFFFSKINHLKNELTKLQSQQKDEETMYQRAVFSIEIISSVIHFTEVFTARIIGMRKNDLYDYLVNYRPLEIKEFYENIEALTEKDIAELIQLPYPFEGFELDEDQVACKRAVKITRGNFAKISKFFLKYRLLYNAYKHGFRVMILKNHEKSGEFLIHYYEKIEKMNEDNLVDVEKNIEDIWDHFIFMSKSLNGIEDNYMNRVFLKKEELTIIDSGLEE